MAGRKIKTDHACEAGTFAIRLRNGGALMGFFDTRQRAERFLNETVPLYISRGYFDDKDIRQEDFEIIKGGK